jgi:hypothetical protein
LLTRGAGFRILAEPPPRLAPVIFVAREGEAGELLNTLNRFTPPVLLELHDDHFHHISAVMMPDAGLTDADIVKMDEDTDYMARLQEAQPEYHDVFRTARIEGNPPDTPPRVAALSTLAAVYEFLKANPDHRLLVAGHSDTTGEDDFNYTIADERARNVLALLQGERSRWVDISLARHRIIDIQRILAHVNRELNWDCFPGPEDDVAGPLLESGVRRFQARYNREIGPPIAVDGVVGRETWGAFFDVYMDDLAAFMGVSVAELPGERNLQFVDHGQRYISCGEKHPIEEAERQNFRSKVNRRVEFLFYPKAVPPNLTCHAATKPFCMRRNGIETCAVYGATFRDFIHIVPTLRHPRRKLDHEPNFEIISTSFPIEELTDGPDEEYAGTMDRQPVDPEDPWGFIEPFDELLPDTGESQLAHLEDVPDDTVVV